MKKSVRLLSLALVLLLAFTGAAVAETEAEQVNMFREYSTEELLAMKIMLETELASRTDAKDFKVTVPQGRYIIGIDIPAGTYTLTLKGLSGLITYFENGESIDVHLLTEDHDTVGKVELYNGLQIEISYGPIVFTPYKGLGF